MNPASTVAFGVACAKLDRKRWIERSRITPVRPERDDDHPDTVDFVVELRNVGRTPGAVFRVGAPGALG